MAWRQAGRVACRQPDSQAGLHVDSQTVYRHVTKQLSNTQEEGIKESRKEESLASLKSDRSAKRQTDRKVGRQINKKQLDRKEGERIGKKADR